MQDFFFFFFLINFFSITDGSCLLFHDEVRQNNCSLLYSNTGNGRWCFRCYIYTISTKFDAIQLNESCSPIPNNHCVDFHFNTTELFREFSRQYAGLTNRLFSPEDKRYAEKTNSLHLHIKYDTHHSFSFDTFRNLDQIENRQYQSISFELKNRQNQITLPLDDDIEKTTLQILQINIYCGAKGLYQYNYEAYQRQSLLKSLTCELPTTTTSITSTSQGKNNISTTLDSRSNTSTTRSILFYSLIGGGSLIPCLIIAFCLYILCEQKNVKAPTNIPWRDSLTSTIPESVFSDDRHVTF